MNPPHLSTRKVRAVLFDLDGVVNSDTIALIDRLSREGIKTALVSSASNSRKAQYLFDLILDEKETQKLKLRGKPQPDLFLKAAEILGIPPKYCVVIEDSLAGVEAGSRGEFALIIGVERAGQAEDLIRHGATHTVKSLVEIEIVNDLKPKDNALLHLEEIREMINKRMPVCFFDGDLISFNSPELLAALQHLKCPTILISKKDLSQIEKIGIERVAYAGSTGMELFDFSGRYFAIDEVKKRQSSLTAAEIELREFKNKVEGVELIRSPYQLTIQYAGENVASEVKKEVIRVQSHYQEDLKLLSDSFQFRLQPNIYWNGGKALLLLLQLFLFEQETTFPIYFGGDEDALFLLTHLGLSLAIQKKPLPTHASFILRNEEEIANFLNFL